MPKNIVYPPPPPWSWWRVATTLRRGQATARWKRTAAVVITTSTIMIFTDQRKHSYDGLNFTTKADLKLSKNESSDFGILLWK